MCQPLSAFCVIFKRKTSQYPEVKINLTEDHLHATVHHVLWSISTYFDEERHHSVTESYISI